MVLPFCRCAGVGKKVNGGCLPMPGGAGSWVGRVASPWRPETPPRRFATVTHLLGVFWCPGRDAALCREGAAHGHPGEVPPGSCTRPHLRCIGLSIPERFFHMVVPH